MRLNSHPQYVSPFRMVFLYCEENNNKNNNFVTTYNNMFVRLGTDYEIRNGGYFESVKKSANQFISKP